MKVYFNLVIGLKKTERQYSGWLITIITLEKLTFPKTRVNLGLFTFQPNFRIYKTNLHELIDTISIIILIISFIWLLLRIINFIALILEQKANLTPDHSDNQLIVFFKDFAQMEEEFSV